MDLLSRFSDSWLLSLWLLGNAKCHWAEWRLETSMKHWPTSKFCVKLYFFPSTFFFFSVKGKEEDKFLQNRRFNIWEPGTSRGCWENVALCSCATMWRPLSPPRCQRTPGIVTPFPFEPTVSWFGWLCLATMLEVAEYSRPIPWRWQIRWHTKMESLAAKSVLGVLLGQSEPQNCRQQSWSATAQQPGLIFGKSPLALLARNGVRSKPYFQWQGTARLFPPLTCCSVFFFSFLDFNKQIVPPLYSDVLLFKSCISH